MDTASVSTETKLEAFASSPSDPHPQDYSRSREVADLIAALAAAMSEVEAITKDRTVEVQTRASGTYKFSYATLDAIIAGIRGPLTKNGLWFTQIVDQAADMATPPILITRLYHKSGQYIQSTTHLRVHANSGNQEFGGALTFMRRYALSGLLGIATDDDDDANKADGNEVLASKTKEPRIPQAPAKDVLNDPIDDIAMDATPVGPHEIDVPKNADEQDDWMGWGKTFIGFLKTEKTTQGIQAWEEANRHSLDFLKENLPKVHTNLTIAILRERQTKEKPNAKPKQT